MIILPLNHSKNLSCPSTDVTTRVDRAERSASRSAPLHRLLRCFRPPTLKREVLERPRFYFASFQSRFRPPFQWGYPAHQLPPSPAVLLYRSSRAGRDSSAYSLSSCCDSDGRRWQQSLPLLDRSRSDSHLHLDGSSERTDLKGRSEAT